MQHTFWQEYDPSFLMRKPNAECGRWKLHLKTSLAGHILTVQESVPTFGGTVNKMCILVEIFNERTYYSSTQVHFCNPQIKGVGMALNILKL